MRKYKGVNLVGSAILGGNKLKVSRVEKHRIKKNNEFFPIVDELCWKSKNVYNYGNYIIRQEFINSSKEKEQGLRENANWIRYNELYHLVKDSDAYRDLKSSASQTTLRKLDKAWKSFFKSIKDYGKNPDKYSGRPKMPSYLPKESGRYECGLNNQCFKIKNGYVSFGWKSMSMMNNTFKTHIPEDAKLIQLRFVPKSDEYIMEVVYEIEVPEIIDKESNRIASIDLGINNLMTITTNCGIEPLVINGKPLMGEQKDIQEVKNAYEAYEQIDKVNPYSVEDLKKIHGILTFLVEKETPIQLCPYNGVNSKQKK